ncbi:MAG: hypothetical protein ABEJ24_03475 [Candidatus Magasanikbacteria bacterium]
MTNINTDSIFILSGPSGAGEDSIIEGLQDKIEVERTITTTTRDMREHESEGNPYHFISEQEFREGIKNDEFFEYAEQDNGNLYGITYEELKRVVNLDKVGVWKIDYKGVKTARKKLPDIIAIMVYAQMENLKDRIISRGTSSDEFVQDRLDYANGWFENEDLFDYKVRNKENQLDKAVKEVLEIIEEECPNKFIHYK